MFGHELPFNLAIEGILARLLQAERPTSTRVNFTGFNSPLERTKQVNCQRLKSLAGGQVWLITPVSPPTVLRPF
jgi:hypothetical protein